MTGREAVMGETRAQIVRGYCDDHETEYVPGVNCLDCGKFVGRDGHIEIATFESSSVVAYVEGTCGKCARRAYSEQIARAARYRAVAPTLAGRQK
jgi:hypothetical protein